MALEKLQLKNLDNGEQFPVLFNPAEYTLEVSNSWEEPPKSKGKPELQFTNQSMKKLTMELFFDTYEQGEDVRTHTARVARLMNVCIGTGDGKRPPRVEIAWGGSSDDFPFIGVLESLKQQFVLFLPNGTPVRARLSVGFKEYLKPQDDARQCPKRNSFPVRTHTVEAGESLASIAASEWRQPERWRQIAEANGIDNPRLLAPGRELVLPAIE